LEQLRAVSRDRHVELGVTQRRAVGRRQVIDIVFERLRSWKRARRIVARSVGGGSSVLLGDLHAVVVAIGAITIGSSSSSGTRGG